MEIIVLSDGLGSHEQKQNPWKPVPSVNLIPWISVGIDSPGLGLLNEPQNGIQKQREGKLKSRVEELDNSCDYKSSFDHVGDGLTQMRCFKLALIWFEFFERRRRSGGIFLMTLPCIFEQRSHFIAMIDSRERQEIT